MEIVDIKINNGNIAIEVTWSDGGILYYPFPWLRDNCQCNDCFDHGFQMRLFLLQTLDPNMAPSKAEVGEAKRLSVTWPDGHSGDYSPEWLYKRGFRKESPVQHMEPLDKRPPKFWGRELQDKIPTMQFAEIMTDDHALYKWIVHLEETGLCLLQSAPTQTGQLHQIASRISQLSYTYYGMTFQVEVKPGPSHPAYTSGTLGFHTDLATCENPTGMEMLHCLAQTSSAGGVNPLVDGFNVAKQMERDYPNLFKLLTTVPIYYTDFGKETYDYFMASKYPCVELDISGEPSKIHWSGHARQSRQNHLPFNIVQPLYEAFCKFEKLMKDTSIQYKLSQGDIICMNNHRVLHGRTAYTLKEGEERHLEGGYLSWDDLRSKRRVLEAKLME